MKKGDLFKWRYTEEYLDKQDDLTCIYHCKSRYAIYDGGKLVDLFWIHNLNKPWDSHATVFTQDDIDRKIHITFLANYDNLEQIAEQVAYNWYHKEDIVDLRHANTPGDSLLFVKKDAKRDPTVRIEKLDEQIRDMKHSIEFRKREIERMEKKKEELEDRIDIMEAQKVLDQQNEAIPLDEVEKEIELERKDE